MPPRIFFFFFGHIFRDSFCDSLLAFLTPDFKKEGTTLKGHRGEAKTFLTEWNPLQMYRLPLGE